MERPKQRVFTCALTLSIKRGVETVGGQFSTSNKERLETYWQLNGSDHLTSVSVLPSQDYLCRPKRTKVFEKLGTEPIFLCPDGTTFCIRYPLSWLIQVGTGSVEGQLGGWLTSTDSFGSGVICYARVYFSLVGRLGFLTLFIIYQQQNTVINNSVENMS